MKFAKTIRFDKSDLNIFPLASEEGEVDKLEGLVTFAASITVTADTTSLTMSFNLGEGMSLNSGGADKIHMGSGPFQAIFTTN